MGGEAINWSSQERPKAIFQKPLKQQKDSKAAEEVKGDAGSGLSNTTSAFVVAESKEPEPPSLSRNYS